MGDGNGPREILRKRLTIYEPVWMDVAPWTNMFLKKNYWRVAALYEWEDVLQEARYTFVRTCNKYCTKYPRVTKKSHFVSLYIRLFTNWFHTLSRQRFEGRAWANTTTISQMIPAGSDATEQGIFESLGHTVPAEVDLVLQLRESKYRVREFLSDLARSNGRVASMSILKDVPTELKG